MQSEWYREAYVRKRGSVVDDASLREWWYVLENRSWETGDEFADRSRTGPILEGNTSASSHFYVSLFRAPGQKGVLCGGEIAEVELVLSSPTGAKLPGETDAAFTVTAEGPGVSVKAGTGNTAGCCGGRQPRRAAVGAGPRRTRPDPAGAGVGQQRDGVRQISAERASRVARRQRRDPHRVWVQHRFGVERAGRPA